MGNCFSSNDTASLRDLFIRPGEPEEQLSAADINNGLTAVADRLHKDGRDISIVAVGSAVNTLYLRLRTTTSDVDFFWSTKTSNIQVPEILQAAKAAALSMGLH
jgi:hypothetical protein